MSEASIIAIVGGALTILLAVGTIVYNAGKNNQFQADIRKIVNGLPARVSVLESQVADDRARCADIEKRMDRVEGR